MKDITHRVKLVVERFEDGDIRDAITVIHCTSAGSAQDFLHWADAKLAEAFERVGDEWDLDSHGERKERG